MSSFTYGEKKTYFRKKWRRDHAWGLAALGLVPLAVGLYAVLARRTFLLGLLPLILFLGHGWAHNRMMIYVESKLDPRDP